jgi:integrase
LTLADYSDELLRLRTDLSPNTRAKYAWLRKSKILPTLGAEAIGTLKPSTVRAWYMAQRAQHAPTADDAYRYLRAVLNTAIADELIVRNPCQVKGAGQVQAAERPVATLAELRVAQGAIPERYRAGFALAAWCMLRRGEVLGLQRRDLDLVHGTVRITARLCSRWANRPR